MTIRLTALLAGLLATTSTFAQVPTPPQPVEPYPTGPEELPQSDPPIEDPVPVPPQEIPPDPDHVITPG